MTNVTDVLFFVNIMLQLCFLLLPFCYEYENMLAFDASSFIFCCNSVLHMGLRLLVMASWSMIKEKLLAITSEESFYEI